MTCCECSPKKQVVTCEHAPQALGPYSVCVTAGALAFCSGQLGLDPVTNVLVDGVEAQTRQALTNLKHILQSAGTSLDNVVKTTVFMKNMSDFAPMNAAYAEFFPTNCPARSTVEVAALPKGGLVEIEAIAMMPCAEGDCC